jgi:23S rRNA pseudouridine2605 synthase
MSPARPKPGGRDRTGAPRDARPVKQNPPRRRPEAPPRDVHDPDGIRLQKVLAQAGIASRRASEELIAAGRVQVDGVTVRELGVRVDPDRQSIHVDGIRIQTDTSKVYLAINKPPGVVSTMSDPEGRPSLSDLLADRLPDLQERLFHVGRLDADTEGLILLTNDGELANRLAHPSHEVPKTYLAEVAGPVARDVGRRLREGIELDDGPVKVDSFRVVDARPGKALVEIVLHEGRNRIVRRMLAAAGHPVLQLVRTEFGPIRLGDLRSGRYRALHGDELGRLFEVAGM